MWQIKICIVFVILVTINVYAQSRTTSALSGLVKDETQHELPRVVVAVTGSTLIGGPRIVTTDLKGRFHFSELPPGSYQITATLSGFKSVRIEQIQLFTGMTLEIPIQMTPYARGQTVIVKAESQPVDSSSAAVATIFSRKFLQNIPTDRDTSHIMDLAPAINLESAYGGGEESGNSYQMDGIDISDPNQGSPWSLFNYSLIDEVQIVGLGAPAEYGQFTGAVFNTVTKSGGNDPSGSAEFFFSNKALTASNAGSEDLSATIEEHQEGTLQIGGPLRKDKLWYFASGQYLHDRASEGGPIETETDRRLFLKAAWKTSDSGTLNGWLEWDHTKIKGRDGDAFTPIEATTGEDNPNVMGNISYSSILSDASIVSIAWGGYSGHHHFNPANGFEVPGHIDAQTGFASNNAAQFGVVDRSRNQINASLTHHTANFITGDHDLKVGTEIEHSVVHDQYGYPGDAFFRDNEGPEQDPSTGKDDFFTLAFLGGGYDVYGTNDRISLFAQDSWRITPRFTLNPGLRMDINRGKVPGATVYKTNPVAPRIGFVWDTNGKSKTIVKGHYGHYDEALYASFYYYLDPGAFAPQRIERIFNTSGFRQIITQSEGQQYAIDPQIKHPHLDQYILGFDQQLPRSILLSGTLVYRRNSNLIETVSRDGIFIPIRGIVPGTRQEVTLFDYLNPDHDVLIYTNPEGLERTYRAVIISASRRFDEQWQLQASYVYSQARGTIDNLGFDESGLGGNTPFFEGHFLDTPNSLVNTRGRLTHDQTHQVKVQGTWVLPSWNLSTSANYTYHSGDTWTARSDCVLTDDGNGVIGDGIIDCHEFPQGPVLYFAESRGSRRLPARNEIDLHIEWDHEIRPQQTLLRLFADIFNLTNQRRATEVETTADEELGQPATLNFPRNIRLGISFSW